MTDSDYLLLRLLGQSDAVWLPMRGPDWSSPYGAAGVWQAQQRFPKRGVPFIAGGRSWDERRAALREVESLVVGGLVQRWGKENSTWAKLTEGGDAWARALAGLPNLIDAFGMLRRVVSLAQRPRDQWLRSRKLCRELWLVGLTKNPQTFEARKPLVELEYQLLPAMCRMWCQARSDMFGQVYYIPTAEGEAVAAGSEPTLPDDLPEKDPRAETIYVETLIACRDHLRTTEPPDGREMGELPLPASIDIPLPNRFRSNKRKVPEPCSP